MGRSYTRSVVRRQPEARPSLTFADGQNRHGKSSSNKRSKVLITDRIVPSGIPAHCPKVHSTQKNISASGTDSSEPAASTLTSSTETFDSNPTASNESDMKNPRCCLICSCFDSCACCEVPEKYDGCYYNVQSRVLGCPRGCPTILPLPEEEEWRSPGINAQDMACCSCCYQPGGIVCMKYMDLICCPLFPVWDCCKGMDYGYRRFRIEMVLQRHKDSKKRRYIPCV